MWGLSAVTSIRDCSTSASIRYVNASVLKVKLATAIIGISSIHLLKTFINAANYDLKVLMWQTIIHVVFLLSALAIALTDRLMSHPSDSH